MNYITSPYIRLHKRSESHSIIINYHINKTQLINNDLHFLLKHCRRITSYQEICEMFGKKLADMAIDKSLILQFDVVWKIHHIRRMEIETVTACNWKCVYCPQHTIKRKYEVMPMTLFNTILERCQKYMKFNIIAFHHYSEPTLDPFFKERVLELAKRNFRFELFTNGKALTEEMICLLKKISILNKIVFNFPSADPAEFCAFTGSDSYYKSKKAIEMCCELGLPVYVTSLHSNKHNNMENINKLFTNAICNSPEIQDRAGSLKHPDYAMNINLHDEKMYGCFYFLHVLYVTVHGDLIPCINDSLNQNYIYGNIVNNEIAEALESESAQEIRKKLFGGSVIPHDFQCRKCIFMKLNKQNLNDFWIE